MIVSIGMWLSCVLYRLVMRCVVLGFEVVMYMFSLFVNFVCVDVMKVVIFLWCVWMNLILLFVWFSVLKKLLMLLFG